MPIRLSEHQVVSVYEDSLHGTELAAEQINHWLKIATACIEAIAVSGFETRHFQGELTTIQSANTRLLLALADHSPLVTSLYQPEAEDLLTDAELGIRPRKKKVVKEHATSAATDNHRVMGA